MALEIERKFLLKRIPKNVKWNKALLINQHYCQDAKGKRFRLREIIDEKNKKKYIITEKIKISNGVYNEKEKEINIKNYKLLISYAVKSIQKHRYVHKIGKLKWEVDKFYDMDLVLAEIEFKKMADWKKLVLPKFIIENLIMEVTEHDEFTSGSLAVPIKKQL